ncbi:MAG: hypothetical protein WCU88_12240 [Elusimicrobiota bacterium]|jgi:hypothetical protein
MKNAAMFLAMLCLFPAALQARSPRSAPAERTAAAPAPSPEQTALKKEIHQAVLEVRRARYALRKAEAAQDASAQVLAQERVDRAKEKVQALRARLKAMLSGQKPPSRRRGRS